ncbi:MAG: putative ABC transporter permease [Bacilli bacterium]
MKLFITLLFLFLIGSMIGYVIELFFRRFVSMKRWINPGLLHGPWLPIYGFGLCLLFFFSNMFTYFNITLNYHLEAFICILLFGVSATLLEYIGGMIFSKQLHIKLWDYSNMKGNYKGVICPQFTTIWIIAAIFYYFLAKEPFNNLFNLTYNYMFIDNNIWLILVIGLVYGLLVGDFISIVKPFTLISSIAKENKYIIEWENIKLHIKENVANKTSLSTTILIDNFILKAKNGIIKPLTKIKDKFVIKSTNKNNNKEEKPNE